MKAHVGVDASSGLVHTVGVTSGNVYDAKVIDRLIRNDDTAIYGDKGCQPAAGFGLLLHRLRERREEARGGSGGRALGVCPISADRGQSAGQQDSRASAQLAQ